MLTEVLWSNLGVWLPIWALLERTQKKLLPSPPIKRLPLVSTSSVPYTGELGIVMGALPGDATVGGTLELHPAAAAVDAVVRLVLESVSRAVRLIDREPLLVAAAGASLAGEQRPGLAAVYRAPQVIAKKRRLTSD